MTIKELCKESYCALCPFYSVCMRLHIDPMEMDDYTNRIITAALINTTGILTKEDSND